jgi:hypothetical protein
MSCRVKTFLDIDINIDTNIYMSKIDDLLVKIKNNPKNVRFAELCKVCDFYFGKARHSSGSHRIYRTPWQGDPRVNIQNNHGKAKAYQEGQVLMAIERQEVRYGTKK